MPCSLHTFVETRYSEAARLKYILVYCVYRALSSLQLYNRDNVTCDGMHKYIYSGNGEPNAIAIDI